ncbi:hypothetical protein, partial [Trichlorobacter sp.]|uniref:hypothetical protein n=1 Tax=Trichlorobacter sp. TaxID=2911007 RepID=UPI002A360E37
AVDFAFHGDLKHEFRINSNQTGFTGGKDFASSLKTTQSKIYDEDANDSFALIKYRLWTEIASDDGGVKGVYAIEIGGVNFGNSSQGGGFSGDGKNVETRWAYTDFALAGGRLKVGLQPVKISRFLWEETATGIHYQNGGLELAWYRGYEVVNTDDSNDFKDLDALYLRYSLKPAAGVKLGLFGLWQHSLEAGSFFANWDLMYQTGDMLEDADFGGYFAHADLGLKMGPGTLTYTVWYASGDDDRSDGDLDAFIVTDTDINAAYSSVVLFQGLNSDHYFAAEPYIQDKGLFLNRLAYEHKLTDKLTVGAAALYLMTAEDLEYTDNNAVDRADDSLGIEIDAWAKYKLYSSLEVALAAGYLAADDALDFYEVSRDGSSDEDIYVIVSSIGYKF